ncbi:MAG: hypothetical protein KDA05_00900 [Phycisphaerales bacterium]|nr:hypothetical protein [Phycisphaerales bacterium]
MSEPDPNLLEEASQYLGHRRELLDEIRELSRTVDRSILGLSSGALGLSLALAQLAGEAARRQSEWLITSWTLLIIAILSCVLSMIWSGRLHDRQRQMLDEEAKKSPTRILDRTFHRYQELRPGFVLLSVLNWSAGLGFCSGVAFLAVFAGSVLL